MNKLQVNKAHVFNVQDAIEHGIEKAVILYHIGFWLEHNRANNTNFHDDHWWTYNSAEAFAILLPYMSSSKIARLLRELEKDGIILVGNYNKVAYDRTKWYSMPCYTPLFKSEQCNVEIQTSHYSNLNNRMSRNVQPIPDINTDINTDINIDRSLLNSNNELNDADEQNPTPSSSNPFNSNVGNKADVFTFDQFWEMYDRKIGRKKCEAKFSKLSDEVKGLIKATLPKYVEITKDGRPQRKHPATYLNNECWNDDLSALAFNDKPAGGSVINTYHPSHKPAAPAQAQNAQQSQRDKEIGMQKAAELKAMMERLNKGASL